MVTVCHNVLRTVIIIYFKIINCIDWFLRYRDTFFRLIVPDKKFSEYEFMISEICDVFWLFWRFFVDLFRFFLMQFYFI